MNICILNCVFRYVTFCLFWFLTVIAWHLTIGLYLPELSFCLFRDEYCLKEFGRMIRHLSPILFPIYMYIIHKNGLKRVLFRQYKKFKLVPKFQQLPFKLSLLSYIKIYLLQYLLFYPVICLPSIHCTAIYHFVKDVIHRYFIPLFFIASIISLTSLISIIKRSVKTVE